MKKLLLSLVLLALCQPVFAQQETPPTGPELTLHFGIYHGGSGRSIVRQFREDGFGEEGTSSAFFFGPEDNPIRSEGSVQLGLLFPFKGTFRAKGLLQYRDTDLEGTAIFFEPLQVNVTVLTGAALGYLPLPFRHVRLGAGPAFHLVRGMVEYGGDQRAKEKRRKLGFALEGGFSFPANKRLFADLQLQYMYVGKVDLGKHTFTENITEESTDTRTVDFSSTKLSTFIVHVGVGFRLYKM